MLVIHPDQSRPVEGLSERTRQLWLAALSHKRRAEALAGAGDTAGAQ
jgi:hypothetical protein